jgi:hypothetical protein
MVCPFPAVLTHSCMASCRRTSARASTRPCAGVATEGAEFQNAISLFPRPEQRQCGTQIPGKPVAPTGEPLLLT